MTSIVPEGVRSTPRENHKSAGFTCEAKGTTKCAFILRKSEKPEIIV